jgi:hypothetical protein
MSKIKHVPTAKTRKAVMRWAKIGIPHTRIAEKLTNELGALNCKDEDTLKKYYKHELQIGGEVTLDRMVKKLEQLAYGASQYDGVQFQAVKLWLSSRGNHISKGAYIYTDKTIADAIATAMLGVNKPKDLNNETWKKRYGKVKDK